MAENQIQNDEGEKVACEVCLKEVPLSAAQNEEVQDYVLHFCGMDCFAKWKEGSDKENKE